MRYRNGPFTAPIYGPPHIRWCRLLGPKLVILGLAALPGCARDQDGPAIGRDSPRQAPAGRAGAVHDQDGPAIDWDSPRMRAIEAEWNSLRDTIEFGPRREGDYSGKDRYGRFVMAVDRLFRIRFSPRWLRELAASPKMPSRAEGGGFVYSVLAFMARAFVDSGDRQGLVELLSKQCPSVVDWPLTIENYLASRGWRLKDPMLVLGEAYARSRAPETRHSLATSVRRSFAGLGIRGKDDAEFVENAMRWYESKKVRLTFNAEYLMNEFSPDGIHWQDSYEKKPDLFDNPPPTREPLYKEMILPPGGGPTNLGEDPDR